MDLRLDHIQWVIDYVIENWHSREYPQSAVLDILRQIESDIDAKIESYNA